ncbi:MAG TPA: PASTA domain-containing protein [Bacilli bacterium]|nr:PASTA domain-containing protein [Bacilli bacterium]
MNARKRIVSNVRAVTLMVLLIVVFVVIIGRIVFIQTTKEVSGNRLDEMAEDQWKKQTVLPGKRGTIFDRDGEALAQEISSYTIYAILNKKQQSYVKDPKKTAEILAPHLDLTVEKVEELLSSDRFQVEFGANGKNLSHEKMEEIESLSLEGIFFRKEPRRYYPKQLFASHIIGYTDRDMAVARMGLEKSMDDLLRGKDGHIVYKKDGKRVKLLNPEENVVPAKNGDNIYLTLDSNIQIALEQVLTKVEEQYNPNKIIAIVADPKTGQILAMGNRPSFNPNQYEDITNYLNNSIADRFEPGSTMKIFTLAAAIEEGVYNGNEEYQSGTYRIGKDVVSDHNKVGWGRITYNEGVERSSNVAFMKIALEKLGEEKLYEYISKFGLDKKTGIDLDGESLSSIAKNSKLDAGATSFGQGTAITAIQQIQGATAIANDGKMMRPYVIDRIVDSENGTVIKQFDPVVAGQPISPATAKEVRSILESVVLNGTGKAFYNEGLDVVGKTGTAQIPKENGKGYIKGHGNNIFSFLGMAPKDDPQVVIYVAVDRPKLKPAESGSAPVAMVFNTILKHSLQYLNISPVKSDQKESAKDGGFSLADYTGVDRERAFEQLDAQGMNVTVIGQGAKVIGQEPKADTKILAGEKVLLLTETDTYQMPNLEGWSFRDLMKFGKLLNLQMNVFGSGYVSKQSIASGDTIKRHDFLTIELKEPNANEQIVESEDKVEERPME